MIITVTINPAVDKTIEVQNFKIGALNRVSQVRLDLGGKGINVSKGIKAIGGESIALGFLGGNSGDFIKKELKSLQISQKFIEVKESTRTNIKLVDIKNKVLTEINETGNPISSEELGRFKDILIGLVKKGDVVVLSGSIPPNLPRTLYYDLIQLSTQKGARVILDADGDLLREGLKAEPYMIKPNLHEIQSLYSGPLITHQEMSMYLKSLITEKLKHIFLTMGNQGTIYVDSHHAFFIPTLNVKVKSAVGAGDALVGAVAYAIENDYSVEDMIKIGIAAASAAVMTEGTQPGNKTQLNDLITKVQIQEIKEV